MPIQPRYLPKDTDPQSTPSSSITVLRTTDNETFLAALIPTTKTLDPPPRWKDLSKPEANTTLAPVLIPTAAVPLSRLLNHPNIVSLVDIIERSEVPGSKSQSGMKRFGKIEYPLDITVWEDMNAGCLSLLLPSPNALPDFIDGFGWHALASQNYLRFSLPESLCWHVLLSISRALLWLHHGVKETEGITGEWMKHDDDWQPVLIRDVSPGQIWFKHPEKDETYGECKLGGFQWAKVTGCAEGTFALAPRPEQASIEKQYYWAPEIYKNTHSYCRKSEIWSLGAVLYTMMTGIPPPRFFDYNWQISRLNDKGFSKGLRDLVAMMLNHKMASRPDALTLVNLANDGWRYWRANTQEGAEYVDVNDEFLLRKIRGARPGMGLMNILGI